MADSQAPLANDDHQNHAVAAAAAVDMLLQDPSSTSVNNLGLSSPQLPARLLQIIDHELTSPNTPSIADIQAYPTAAYFNHTVIPIIIEGLAIVAKERPKKPIEYLAAFLTKNRERFGEHV